MHAEIVVCIRDVCVPRPWWTVEAGIIDPTKVTRCALENAVSIAGTILLTECTLVEKPKEKTEESFGGMTGMY